MRILSTRLPDITFIRRPSSYMVKPGSCYSDSSSLVKPYRHGAKDQLGEFLIRPNRTCGSCTRTLCTAASQANFRKQWKDAASLMVITKDKNQPKNSVFDYKILFLERQGGSSAYGGNSVFPGGVVDDADFSPEWIQLFRKLGIETMDNFGWSHMKNKPRAGPIASPRAKGLLPNDVAFRLCAIRETFEESGILLAGRWDNVRESMEKVSAKSFAPSSCYVELDENKFLEWRKRIFNDAGQFLVMCQELDIFPNLWSLFEVNNNLTPRTYASRFDIIFYMSTLDVVPKVIINEKEMKNNQWLNPADGINHYCQGGSQLLPPQVIECARCLNFPTLTDVQDYAAKIMDEGMAVHMPVDLYLEDCLLFTFPGDDAYPEKVSFASISKIPRLKETEEQNLKRCKNLHRFTMYGQRFKFDCNIKLHHGHQSPQSFSSQDWLN